MSPEARGHPIGSSQWAHPSGHLLLCFSGPPRSRCGAVRPLAQLLSNCSRDGAAAAGGLSPTLGLGLSWPAPPLGQCAGMVIWCVVREGVGYGQQWGFVL